MITFRLVTETSERTNSDRISIVCDQGGDTWCVVRGTVGVNLGARACTIANALAFYLNNVRPHTTRGSRKVTAIQLAQMELLFPED
jgi:hypothetical protein